MELGVFGATFKGLALIRPSLQCREITCQEGANKLFDANPKRLEGSLKMGGKVERGGEGGGQRWRLHLF